MTDKEKLSHFAPLLPTAIVLSVMIMVSIWAVRREANMRSISNMELDRQKQVSGMKITECLNAASKLGECPGQLKTCYEKIFEKEKELSKCQADYILRWVEDSLRVKNNTQKREEKRGE